MYNSRRRRGPNVGSVAVSALVTVAVVALIGFALDTFGGFNPLASTLNLGHLLWGLLAPWKFVLIVAGVSVPVLALTAGSRNPKSFDIAMTVVVLLLIIATGLSIRTVNRWGHDVAHDQITGVLTVSDDDAPTYETRDPYELATARLQRSVGDSSGYEVPADNVWRFEVDGTAQTCGLKAPNANAWKRPMGGVVCVDDTGRVTEAAFDGQVPSWLVAFGHLRLADKVNDVFPRGRFEVADVYGYIDADGPHMVVPTTRMMGGGGWYTGWVGAVVFDVDGTARAVTDPSTIPGPVVGESVADEVLDALAHRAGFMDSRRNQTRFDLGDGANVRHFLLERGDGDGERLVTLLTPRGSSETVSAILEIDPHTIVDGWPTATLYTLDTRSDDGTSRASVREVLDLVGQRYGTAMMLGEAQQRVMEATPGDPDVLMVTVGSNQRVFARVSVNMMTRESCVFAPDGTEIRCSSGTSAPLAFGSLPGLFNNDDGATSDAAVSPGDAELPVGELSELSDDELFALLREVTDELDARRVPLQPAG